MERKTVDFGSRMIIAELGMTHDGSFGQAKAMIKAAAECGVDAVKLQTHIADAETTKDAPTPPYFQEESRYDYFQRTAFDKNQWIMLRDFAIENGVLFVSSPFSIEAIDFLNDIGIDIYKVPSGEITNIPYLEHLAELNVPTIISSGMSSNDEIDECMSIFMRNDCNVAILQCTSEYPCSPEHVGLNVIDEYKMKFPQIPVGFSDHTSGEWAAIAAYTRGARIIEKHFTLSKKMYGPDAKMSMDPVEMTQLCQSIKLLDEALLHPVDKSKVDGLENMREVFQKSIVAGEDIPEGTILQKEMLAYKKPGTGLKTKYYKDLIGRKTVRLLRKDEFIKMEDVD